MPKVWIDGKEYEVRPNLNMLEAALEAGLNLPYFCWHPAMGSVGACRQCAVKQYRDENDTTGKLTMACMTPAKDGTRVSICEREATEFRASVIEWLMENHPHDCPICDEGGECHLQDMTVMSGHNYREYRFPKRTHKNQYLGPLINHEMNRCIQCYRCVRFYADHAGGTDLQALAAHDHLYFGRYADGVLESELSGNLVEVCPTGVFTDKTLKQHYTRKWDLQTAPSVCVHCGMGCNTIPGERYGKLRRVRNRYHDKVNGYFLCDRGRYGYEFVNSERRLLYPLMPQGADKEARAIRKDAAITAAVDLLKGKQRVIGIGSPRASMESNFALRTLVGADNFYQGIPQRQIDLESRIVDILRKGPSRSASLREIGECDAVLILGEDLPNTAPMAAYYVRELVKQQPREHSRKFGIPDWQVYAVRDAVQKMRGPCFIATPTATRIDNIARQTYRAAPADIARLGFAVAHTLDGASPAVSGASAELLELADAIATALSSAKRPLVIAGTSLGDRSVLDAAANVAWALAKGPKGAAGELFFVVPQCNSTGAALLGGKSLEEAGVADVAIILENDLPEITLSALGNATMVLDHLATETAARANLVLPAGTFAESNGTMVNSEGRAQRFFQVYTPEGDIQSSWRWLRDIGAAVGNANMAQWSNLDSLHAALATELPELAGIKDAAPSADFRIAGERLPRETHRYSGRTSMHANVSVHEPTPPVDPDAPLSYSMEGYEGEAPAALVSHYWAPGWNSVQSLNRFQEELAGPLRGGPAGVRLVDGPADAEAKPYRDIPAPFSANGSSAAVPLYHVFGSESLSLLTPGIAELAPAPYVALSTSDAKAIGIADGDEVICEGATFYTRLQARVLGELPEGMIGVPQGLPGVPAAAPGSNLTVRKP